MMSWALMKHGLEAKVDAAAMWVARRLPARLRKAVVLDAFVRASDPRSGGPVRGGYAGPDGLMYEDAMRTAEMTRREQRQRQRAREQYAS